MGFGDQEFTTGLLDDFDFECERAFFGFDEKYSAQAGGDVPILQLWGKTDNPDQPETHLYFTVGSGWEIRDGGKSIERGDGKDPKFNQNTLYARLLKRCAEDFGIAEILDARGTVFDAPVWEGIKFHCKQENMSFGGGGNVEARMKVMPVAFLGFVGDGETKKASGPKSASTKAPKQSAADKVAAAKAKKAAEAGGNDEEVSPLKAAVIALFNEHDDFGTAQDAALALDGVTDDDALLESIMDDSGLWAEVKG